MHSTKSFLSVLLKELNKNNIKYAVLRNYELLPERALNGSDIDFIIDKNDIKKILITLKNISKKTDSFIFQKIKQSNCISFFVYQKSPFLGIWIDFFYEMSAKSFIWANTDILLKNRILNPKGFYTISYGGEAATLFVRGTLFSTIKKRYLPIISEFAKKDEGNFIKTLTPYFKKEIVQEMLNICQNSNWEDISVLRKKWLKNLIFRSFFKNPIRQNARLLIFTASQIKKSVASKHGFIITFIGPDGVGKTTTIKETMKYIENFHFTKTYQYHGQFGLFPELSRVYKFLFRADVKEFSSRPESQSKFGKGRALAHIFYYGLEFIISWPWVIWGYWRGYLFIFDRYFYDFFVTSVHRSISPRPFFIISKLIPHPDLIIIVNAKPKEVYKRKQEWPVDEIKKQLDFFKSPEILKMGDYIIINSEKSVDENAKEIKKKMLAVIEKKYNNKIL